MSNAGRSVAQGVGWSLVRAWGSRLIGFFIYFQLARLLSPEDMGLFAASFAVLALLEMLVDLGLIQAIVRQPQLTNAQLNAVFVANMALATALLLILACAAPFLESWLNAPGLRAVVLVSGLGLIFTALGMCQEALARKELDFRLMATRTLLATGTSGAIGVSLAYMGYGVWSLVWQFVLAGLVNTATMWIHPRWRPSRDLDFQGLGDLLKFGISMFGQRLISFADSRGVDMLIGALYGPASLGIYSVGTKLQYICTQLFGTAFVDVAFPAFTRIQNDPKKLREANIEALRMLALFSMPLWCILGGTAPESIAVAFGSQWSAAAPILTTFALVGFVQSITLFDPPLLNATGHTRLNVSLGLAKAALILCSIAWIGDEGTVQKAAIAIFIANCVSTGLYVVTVQKVSNISAFDKIKAVWPAALGCAFILLAIHQCRQAEVGAQWPAAMRLCAYALTGAVIYILVLAFAARETVRDAVKRIRQR